MWVTHQSFLESPDNARVLFTTNAPVREGTLVVDQGGVVLTAFTRLSSTQIQCSTPPASAAGSLYWAGDTLTVANNETVGLWTLQTFQDEYNIQDGTPAALRGGLTRADREVQALCTASAYATALSDTTSAEYSVLKYVIGDLAKWYLVANGTIKPGLSAYTENFDGVKQYSKTYNSVSQVIKPVSKEDILSPLRPYLTTGAVVRAAGVPQSAAFTPKYSSENGL